MLGRALRAAEGRVSWGADDGARAVGGAGNARRERSHEDSCTDGGSGDGARGGGGGGWRGGWATKHVAAGGADTLGNCEVPCIPCHKKTQTYGG